jgi:hypothetical protein
MRNSQNIKSVVLSEASASTLTASVDTQGFRFARIAFTSASTGAPTTNCKLEQSDDNSTWEAIRGIVLGTDYTLGTTTNLTTRPKIVWDVNLAGRKRYLKATVEHASASRGQLNAMLLDPIDGITTVAETGAANYVIS